MAPASRYHPLSIGLHWFMAALIIVLLVGGFAMDGLPKGQLKGAVFNVHKLLGVIVLALALVRLAWRARHAPPQLAPAPAWQAAAARAAHALLYAAMFVMPVSGLLFTHFGRGVRIFGLAVPQWGGPNESVSHVFHDLHESAAILLAAMVVVHVLAALWHHFARGDATLARMLPGRAMGAGAG
jgi:cytochrome b561